MGGCDFLSCFVLFVLFCLVGGWSQNPAPAVAFPCVEGVYNHPHRAENKTKIGGGQKLSGVVCAFDIIIFSAT